MEKLITLVIIIPFIYVVAMILSSGSSQHFMNGSDLLKEKDDRGE